MRENEGKTERNKRKGEGRMRGRGTMREKLSGRRERRIKNEGKNKKKNMFLCLLKA